MSWQKINLPLKKIKDFFNNSKSILDKKYIIKICQIINADPNFFIDKNKKRTQLGNFILITKTQLKVLENLNHTKLLPLQIQKDFLTYQDIL